MNSSSRMSLLLLQKEMEREISKLPLAFNKSKSADLRHTLGSKPSSKMKNCLKKIRSLKSLNPESARKRDFSVSSTKSPEPSHSPLLSKIDLRERRK